MSTEHHNTGQPGDPPPTNTDVAFESSDIDVRTILAYLFYLAITVAAAFFVTVYIFRFTTTIAVDTQTLPPPVRQGVAPTMPPEPRLQGVPGHTNDAQLDLRDKREADNAANEDYGWIDQRGGIAQIPVEEAMKIIVSKGLPAVAAPAAEKKK
jgi:hypothetical protein